MVDAEELFVGHGISEIVVLDVEGHVAGSALGI